MKKDKIVINRILKESIEDVQFEMYQEEIINIAAKAILEEYNKTCKKAINNIAGR